MSPRYHGDRYVSTDVEGRVIEYRVGPDGEARPNRVLSDVCPECWAPLTGNPAWCPHCGEVLNRPKGDPA